VPETLFAYIDSTSNAVLSKGFSPSDFVDGIVHQPKHLLLLDPVLIKSNNFLTTRYSHIQKELSGLILMITQC